LRISIIGQQTQALYNLFGVGTGPESRIEEVVENVATEGRPYKGSADAPVTIVEFSNFTCPACAMVQPALKELLVVREGQVGLVFRHFPLGPPHTDGFRAAVAAECAAQQGVFWEMHDSLFAHAETLSENDLLGYAAGLGVDEVAFAACLDSDDAEVRIREDIAAGQEYGVTGTPTFFINGRRVSGTLPLSDFEALVDDGASRNREAPSHNLVSWQVIFARTTNCRGRCVAVGLRKSGEGGQGNEEEGVCC